VEQFAQNGLIDGMPTVSTSLVEKLQELWHVSIDLVTSLSTLCWCLRWNRNHCDAVSTELAKASVEFNRSSTWEADVQIAHPAALQKKQFHDCISSLI
jgi:hypothetical protein